MKRIPGVFVFCVLIFSLCWATASAKNGEGDGIPERVSKETKTCIECHKAYNPGIVEDWLQSRHAKVTPKDALQKQHLQRRVSSKEVPAALQDTVVGCYECHALNRAAHTDSFEHLGVKINVVVSPNDCRTCHDLEVEQYGKGKKAHALANLEKNPVYSQLVETITSLKNVRAGNINSLGSSDNTKNETCYACHGTYVATKGLKKISTDLGDMEVPDLVNWPNQGVGRINPDGSAGSCTPCHGRHSFSIETARKPYTCSRCHVEPDAPAYNVYMESKHGSIFSAREGSWDFANVPWVAGKDFRTPTCAACHNSLVTGPGGDVIAERSHDFGSRLWVRIFGLIYAHSQPKDGRTYVIRNKDGLPLPVTFGGEPASEYLIDKKEQGGRRARMASVCKTCHGSGWVEGHFAKLDRTISETDKMVLASTVLLERVWDKKAANKVNPFDETVEQKWLRQWLFYGNSVRHSSAMGGPDFATFKNGWWNMTTVLEEMNDLVHRRTERR